MFGGLYLVCVFVDVHRTELIAIEVLPIKSCTFLPEEDGAWTLNLNDEADDGDQREQHQADDRAEDEVEGALDDPVEWVFEWLPVVGEHVETSEVDGAEREMVGCKLSHHVEIVDEVAVAILHEIHDHLCFFLWQAAVDLVGFQQRLVGLCLGILHAVHAVLISQCLLLHVVEFVERAQVRRLGD